MKSRINIPKSFFGFLIASFLFWLLANLSKEYITTINYYVDYKKLAQNKIFEEEPVQEIPIRVKATGFKLLSANFSKRTIDLLVDKLKTKSNGMNYFLPNQQAGLIQKQLYSGLRLDRVLTDTIDLHLGILATKKVPVIANNQINFELGYDFATPIHTIPDSITVSGPDAQLSVIKSVDTKSIVFENLSESQIINIGLEVPSDNEKVKISHNVVEVVIDVDKFTEGSFYIPFEIENLPFGTKINTFPKNVKLTYKVGLNNFNKITPESFKVICDYRASKENDLSYLIPKIEMKPSLVKSARISPNKIDFLIQK